MLDVTTDLASLALAGDSENTVANQGNALVEKIGLAEWLGPLAPVAISPFFGLCLLSGMATYGPEWLRERNTLLQNSELLNSPWLFWSMFTLAILTSLPRLTKVSKPIALAAENLEAYSAVIILIAVRMLGAQSSSEVASDMAGGLTAAEHPYLAAGFVSWSSSLLLSLFAAMNILVINAVKLFFEFLVWLIPFPAVDAALEAANKATCAGLMLVYTFSPTLATVLNLSLLVLCAMAFGWTQRRLRYYQSIVLGPLLAWWLPGWFAQRGEWMTVVCDEPLEKLPRYSRLQMRIEPDGRARLRGRWLWRTLDWDLHPCQLESQPQLVACRLLIHHAGQPVASLLHRRWLAADECFNWHDWKAVGRVGRVSRPFQIDPA